MCHTKSQKILDFVARGRDERPARPLFFQRTREPRVPTFGTRSGVRREVISCAGARRSSGRPAGAVQETMYSSVGSAPRTAPLHSNVAAASPPTNVKKLGATDREKAKTTKPKSQKILDFVARGRDERPARPFSFQRTRGPHTKRSWTYR